MRILKPDKIFNKDKVKKILLIRIDRLGDLILTTPAIKAVRNEFKQAQVHLLVNEYAQDLVVNNPNIDRLLIYKKNLKLEEGYDLAVCFHRGYLPNKIAFKSQAVWRVGFSGAGGSFFLTHVLFDDRLKRARHEVEFSLEAAQIIGADLKDKKDKKLEISITQAGEEFADKFYQDNKISRDDLVIIMHPGARQEYIRWKKQGFAAVADELISQYQAKVIMTGSKSEQALLLQIKNLMKYPAIITPGIKLTELVSIMDRGNLYIGNITGPMHIACALDLPVVAITGMTGSLDDTRYWGPRCSDFEIVSKDMGCKKCVPGDCKTFECIQSISVEDVMDATLRIIKRHAA
ncbi:MAG: glycosyltransferase family 9 protein [Candidatus Omnitrophota bacterium]